MRLGLKGYPLPILRDHIIKKNSNKFLLKYSHFSNRSRLQATPGFEHPSGSLLGALSFIRTQGPNIHQKAKAETKTKTKKPGTCLDSAPHCHPDNAQSLLMESAYSRGWWNHSWIHHSHAKPGPDQDWKWTISPGPDPLRLRLSHK